MNSIKNGMGSFKVKEIIVCFTEKFCKWLSQKKLLCNNYIKFMKIFIIRHGETTSDIDNLYGGDYDDHLTEKGVQQAEELAQKLVNYGIQIIFSSSRIRARETSDILKCVLKVDVEVVDDIRERNGYGILTGVSKDDRFKPFSHWLIFRHRVPSLKSLA